MKIIFVQYHVALSFMNNMCHLHFHFDSGENRQSNMLSSQESGQQYNVKCKLVKSNKTMNSIGFIVDKLINQNDST